MLVAVLHSLLFDVIPHPSVSYRQVFIPILYFQPSLSQSDSRHFHFNLSELFFHSFIASVLALSGDFLPTGVFYLMLFIHIFSHNLLLSRFPWEPAVLPWSLQGFMLILEVQTWPMWLFDSQQSDYLIHSNPQSWYSKEFIFKAYQILPWITCSKNFSYLLLTRFELFLLVQSIC